VILLPGYIRFRGKCEKLVRDTVEEYGWIDILVNNAGLQHILAMFGITRTAMRQPVDAAPI
jgi:NAD(P)-dependent dehydrogenase (short-subunit alcohol dehydrogenase family)